MNEKTIQRDIEDIGIYLEDQVVSGNSTYGTVIYNRLEKGYQLEKIYNQKLTNGEILAICKMLMDCRAFTKKQMDAIIGKLIDCCVPQTNYNVVKKLVSNEQYHYIEPGI